MKCETQESQGTKHSLSAIELKLLLRSGAEFCAVGVVSGRGLIVSLYCGLLMPVFVW